MNPLNLQPLSQGVQTGRAHTRSLVHRAGRRLGVAVRVDPPLAPAGMARALAGVSLPSRRRVPGAGAGARPIPCLLCAPTPHFHFPRPAPAPVPSRARPLPPVTPMLTEALSGRRAAGWWLLPLRLQCALWWGLLGAVETLGAPVPVMPPPL